MDVTSAEITQILFITILEPPVEATPRRQVMWEVSITWLPQSFETMGCSLSNALTVQLENLLAGVGTGTGRLAYLMKVIIRQVEGIEMMSG